MDDNVPYWWWGVLAASVSAIAGGGVLGGLRHRRSKSRDQPDHDGGDDHNTQDGVKAVPPS